MEGITEQIPIPNQEELKTLTFVEEDLVEVALGDRSFYYKIRQGDDPLFVGAYKPYQGKEGEYKSSIPEDDDEKSMLYNFVVDSQKK